MVRGQTLTRQELAGLVRFLNTTVAIRICAKSKFSAVFPAVLDAAEQDSELLVFPVSWPPLDWIVLFRSVSGKAFQMGGAAAKTGRGWSKYWSACATQKSYAEESISNAL